MGVMSYRVEGVKGECLDPFGVELNLPGQVHGAEPVHGASGLTLGGLGPVEGEPRFAAGGGARRLVSGLEGGGRLGGGNPLLGGPVEGGLLGRGEVGDVHGAGCWVGLEDVGDGVVDVGGDPDPGDAGDVPAVGGGGRLLDDGTLGGDEHVVEQEEATVPVGAGRHIEGQGEGEGGADDVGHGVGCWVVGEKFAQIRRSVWRPW